MKDLIDQRNEKEKIRSSIIKSWNVNYQNMSPHKVSSQPKEEEDAGKKQKRDYLYNEKTGAYSGMYGQGEVDGVNRGQIDKILREKTEELRELLIRQGVN